MVWMSEKVEVIRTFAEVSFDRFDRAVKDLTEKEADWRPVEEANSIGWILNISRRNGMSGFPGS